MNSNVRWTRLAPSPTGALHLGNARTFLVNWALARQQGWQILLRMDDLDGPRIKVEAAREAMEDLQWLGVTWDLGPVFQTADLDPYTDALKYLWERGQIYPCSCTRSQIAEASAPHAGEHELRYPGACRGARSSSSPQLSPSDVCFRVRCPDVPSSFEDEFAGRQTQNIQRQVGDFVVRTKQGLPSYQLATVVDDQRQGVTDIVRGDDLIDSTHRQRHLQSLLGIDNSGTKYWHLPIVVGEDGRRLAKRHGDSRIHRYREDGVAPERILGLLQHWCGGDRQPCSCNEFLDNFDMQKLPRERIVMSRGDHQWLLESS